MKILCIMLLAAGLALAGCMASTVTVKPAPAPKHGKVAMAKKKPEVICKWEVQVGSRIKKKVCRTRATIEAQKRHDQRMMRDLQQVGHGPRDDNE